MDGYDKVFQHPNLVSVCAEKTLPVHQEPDLLELCQEPANCCTLQYAEHKRCHHRCHLHKRREREGGRDYGYLGLAYSFTVAPAQTV